ncbi:hypothetical protein TYRP_006199 [Tyrophagus putrescentiae]|nr:hypothetical protein TYRP_006199 [Tyrophagus putrescentiae]
MKEEVGGKGPLRAMGAKARSPKTGLGHVTGNGHGARGTGHGTARPRGPAMMMGAHRAAGRRSPLNA